MCCQEPVVITEVKGPAQAKLGRAKPPAEEPDRALSRDRNLALRFGERLLAAAGAEPAGLKDPEGICPLSLDFQRPR
jgi:hypothetical protein